MAMSDEERLIEAYADMMAERFYLRAFGELRVDQRMNLRMECEGIIAGLRKRGVTLTIEPAPEPTYTITLTAQEREMAGAAILYKRDPSWRESEEGNDAWRDLYLKVSAAKPDPA